MADNIPNIPQGAVPPKKETGKVQPKKETVRINLPPKPSAAPTIKLPTLPPSGGPAPGIAPAPAAAPAAHAAPAAAPAPAAPRPAVGAAPAPVSQRPMAPTAPRSAAPAAGPAMKPLDTILAIAAAVAGLAAIGTTVWMLMILGQ